METCGDRTETTSGESVTPCHLPKGHSGEHNGFCLGSKAVWRDDDEGVMEDFKYSCTEQERKLLDKLYADEPDLKKAGIDEFDGWYVHLDEVTDRCLQAWPNGDPGCTETPLEYITAIIDERDDIAKELATAKSDLATVQQATDRLMQDVIGMRDRLVKAEGEMNSVNSALMLYHNPLEEWTPENPAIKIQDLGERAKKAEAANAKLIAERDRLREFVINMAQRPCEFPPQHNCVMDHVSRPPCDSCKARAALADGSGG